MLFTTALIYKLVCWMVSDIHDKYKDTVVGFGELLCSNFDDLRAVSKHMMFSTASKYSSVGHHEQKNKKSTSQIKFLAVMRKQQIKLVLQHSLYKSKFNVLVQVLLFHSFIYMTSCLLR